MRELSRDVSLLLAAAALCAAGPLGQARAQSVYDDNCVICRTKRRFEGAVPWLKLGADLRYRFYRIDNSQLDKRHRDHEFLFQRGRARFWTRITPVADLHLNARLMAEPRYWCKPDSKEPWTHTEVFLDQLNVEWAKAFGLPLKFTVGRQDFKFGEGWLLRDGTPLDGGRSTFFDAARATLSLDEIKTAFDLIYIDNHADTAWLHRPFCDDDIDIAEHEERGAVFYVSHKGLKDHTIDGYFIYKHTEAVVRSGWDSEVYTVGARVKGAIDEHWKYRAEIAPQWGRKNGTRLCALGGNSELAYHLNDAWKNDFHVQYEYRSGGAHTEDGAFDILWGRWYQGSNLYHFYLSKLETLMGASSNLHRLGLGWYARPTKRLWLAWDYHLLFRDRNTFSGRRGFSEAGEFRGQLITGVIGFDQDEHVEHHLMLDFFFPGNYYSDDRNDASFFLKYQVVFTW